MSQEFGINFIIITQQTDKDNKSSVFSRKRIGKIIY